MALSAARPKLPLTPAVLHILLALKRGPLHGYAVMRSVAETAGTHVPAGASTIYGCLARMTADGLIAEVPPRATARSRGRPRRAFALTARGREALSLESARLLDTVEALWARGVIRKRTR
jgi:DNA-binding PadR family transcriptional regulator